MENSLIVLIPLSLLLVLGIAWVLWWSVKSGQFEDMEGPAFRVLMDDDTVKHPESPGQLKTGSNVEPDAQADKPRGT